MIASILFFILAASAPAADSAQQQKEILSKLAGLDRGMQQIDARLSKIESFILHTQVVLGQVQAQVNMMQVQIAHINKVGSWFEQPPPPTVPVSGQ